MERQRLIIIALLAICISSCQQTEALFIQEPIIEPIQEIIPAKLDIPEEDEENDDED